MELSLCSAGNQHLRKNAWNWLVSAETVVAGGILGGGPDDAWAALAVQVLLWLMGRSVRYMHQEESVLGEKTLYRHAEITEKRTQAAELR